MQALPGQPAFATGFYTADVVNIVFVFATVAVGVAGCLFVVKDLIREIADEGKVSSNRAKGPTATQEEDSRRKEGRAEILAKVKMQKKMVL